MAGCEIGRETERRAGQRVGRGVCFFITIMVTVLLGQRFVAAQVTNPAPVSGVDLSGAAEGLPDSPGTVKYPDAEPVPPASTTLQAEIDADYKKYAAGHFTLEGHVRIRYQGRTLTADHAEYDENSGDVTLTGHVVVMGGENDEVLNASHAEMNTHTATGTLYDVSGTVGIKPVAPGRTEVTYTNGNPFRFTGRRVVKTGPQEYEVYDGTVTSCALATPDWVLSAAKFSVDEKEARAKNSVFHLLNVPILYLPYVTHPRAEESRQSGLLIPVLGDSSDKGITIGDQIYWAINRSTDLTVGSIYYSLRGWSQTARFQYRGHGDDFVRAHYSQLEDRGYTPSGGQYTNQSGTDLTFSGRHDFGTGDAVTSAADEVPAVQTRAVADVEYLSSFAYREAFTENFNQAVSSDVISTTYATHEWNGYAASLEADRYQGEKRIAQYTAAGFQPEQQAHLFHAPSLEFESVDRRLGGTRLEWSVESAATGLKRVTPAFSTGGLVERLDVRPELALPFHLGGLSVRPSAAVRDTFYTRSRVAGTRPQVEEMASLNRLYGDFVVDVRAPVLERTFDSGWVTKMMRHDVRHTIEPRVTYRYVTGVDNFQRILQFDPVDVVSNTNELEYGVTQRVYLRNRANEPCEHTGANANEVLGPTDAEAQDMEEAGDVADAADTGVAEAAQGAAGAASGSACGARQWISWTVAQKYFFNQNFDGAVVSGPRTVLDTTLGFTGIAFLTRPRNVSPVISRLRVRTSEKTDVEWDFDIDPCGPPQGGQGPAVLSTACHPTLASNNVFVDVHQGSVFGGVSYAWLNAPERSYVEGQVSSFAQFDQMRVLLGWGKPTRRGLSVAANTGLDLDLATVQYGALETSYNWNCCGFSVEYRKYELGTARNENAYRFNFTLANIGTAGNLRRAQGVF